MRASKACAAFNTFRFDTLAVMCQRNRKKTKVEGMLVPAGQGNMAIIGDPGERLVAIADKLEHAIAWHI